MEQDKITLSSSVLKWARVTLFGSRKDEAASRLKITVSELDSWENSDPAITPVILKRISKVYKRHVSVLLLKNPPISQEAPKFRKLSSFENLDFDRKTFLTIRHAQEIQSTASYLLNNVDNAALLELTTYSNNWEKLAVKAMELLHVDKDSRFKSKTSREQLAIWKRRLESLGIIVLQQSFPLKDSRAFTIYNKVAPIIVLNSSDTDNARIFSLFHELGHLALRQTDADFILDLSINSTRSDEFFCNKFAASFLVPENLLKEAVGAEKKFDDDYVKLLADIFKVSTSVIWIKLFDTKYIGFDEFKKIKNRLSVFEGFSKEKKAKKSGGNKNTYLYTTINKNGEFYLNEVFDAYNAKRISYYEVLDFIGIKSHTLPKLQKLMYA